MLESSTFGFSSYLVLTPIFHTVYESGLREEATERKSKRAWMR